MTTIGHCKQTGRFKGCAGSRRYRYYEWECQGAGDEFCGNLFWYPTHKLRNKKHQMCAACRREYGENVVNGQGAVKRLDDGRIARKVLELSGSAAWLTRALV